MTSGPKVCQLVKEYDANSKLDDIKHHEDFPSTQKRFFNEVKALTESFNELGNPFMEESDELLAIDSKYISSPTALNEF